jgi:hypothetical protein
MDKKSVAIKMPVKELVAEHSKLVSDLKSGKKSKLQAEAKRQGKELKEYKEKL